MADKRHNYDDHHHGNEKLVKLDQHMAKYDTDGDGVFSPEEVRNIVRDMESAEQSAKNMGKLAAIVAIVGLCLCGALLGLMFAANEASKEGHIDGGVSVDLDGNLVQTAQQKAYASMFDFPNLPASVLNEVGYVSFSATDGTEQFDMRFQISAWTRSQTTKLTVLETNGGSKIVIVGDGSSAMLVTDEQEYSIVKPASRRRLTSGHRAKLFGSAEELQQYFGTGRRLTNGNKVPSEPLAIITNTNPAVVDEAESQQLPAYCYYSPTAACIPEGTTTVVGSSSGATTSTLPPYNSNFSTGYRRRLSGNNGTATTYSLDIVPGSWSSELSWQFDDQPTVGYYNPTGSSSGSYAGPFEVTLGAGIHTLALMDSFGDGWNGASLTLTEHNDATSTVAGPFGTYFTTGYYDGLFTFETLSAAEGHAEEDACDTEFNDWYDMASSYTECGFAANDDAATTFPTYAPTDWNTETPTGFPTGSPTDSPTENPTQFCSSCCGPVCSSSEYEMMPGMCAPLTVCSYNEYESAPATAYSDRVCSANPYFNGVPSMLPTQWNGYFGGSPTVAPTAPTVAPTDAPTDPPTVAPTDSPTDTPTTSS
jgi:hypothetical protein